MEVSDNEEMVTSDNEEEHYDLSRNGKEIVENEDSSEEEEDDEEEKQLEMEAESLERQISQNKYLYDVHVKLLDVYKRLADLNSLRAAYKRFSEYFPLTPELWANWLDIEKKLCTNNMQRDQIKVLYDLAVKDYLSANLWMDYIQFALQHYEAEDARRVLERAINAVGLHTRDGNLVWNSLREFEIGQLSQYSPSSDGWQHQVNKVVDVFKRHLSVPLLGMEKTYSEWHEWLDQLSPNHGIDPKCVDWTYQNALKLLEIYKPFEDKLSAVKGEEEIYLVYQEYIVAVTDPATVLCIYERAVADISLNTSLWLKYCLYAFYLGKISIIISKNAVRNCPWCEELWVMRLRILEEHQCSKQDVIECFEQGLAAIAPSPGLNLWLSYLEYVRRTSDSTDHLHKAFSQAADQLGETGDPSCIVLRMQACMYAHKKNMAMARQVWSNILRSTNHKSAASAWLEFVSLEKHYGDEHHVRLLFKRALSACPEWSQYIAEEWMMYERQFGSLKNVLECEDKCKKIIEEHQKVVHKNSEESFQNKKRSHESKNDNEYSKTKRPKTTSSDKPLPKKKIVVSDIDSEKSVFVSNIHENVDEDMLQALFPSASAICIPPDRKGKSRCYAYVQFNEKSEVEKALTRDREKLDGRPLFISKCLLDQSQRKTVFNYATSSEENKLFVRGLPHNYSQEDVEGFFKPHGAVAVRLVTHRSGRSKGLAYVEFKNKDAANAALMATDQTNIEGHVITVAISAPPPKKSLSDSGGTYIESTPTRHARSRLQIPLIPSSLLKKNTETIPQEASKSNEDFRKMFLK